MPASRNQKIDLPILSEKQITLEVKREDELHPHISGNKYRKLKYNLIAAEKENFHTLLTFGGAYSNHIAAVAAAGKEYSFHTVGIIRGEELSEEVNKNPTLNAASKLGMKFEFVSRSDYRAKTNPDFLKRLRDKFGDFYMLPEGGTNKLAVKGCEEILSDNDINFDYVCCAVGTGGTLSGLINCSKPGQQVLGFPALKGGFLQNDIRKFARNENWKLIPEYHFGGYAKVNEELIRFINSFKKDTGVPLDPVYTGKMLYGILDLVKKGFFKRESRILAIHTGGLQGIKGMNRLLKQKHALRIDE